VRALVLALLLLAPAAEAQMYKCKDERGVTHYSDKPRPGCVGGPVDIRPIAPASGKLAAPARDLKQEDAAFKRRQLERAEAEEARRAEQEKRCTALRREQASLSRGTRVMRATPAGERVFVDDGSRDKRLGELKEALRGCP
jgi:hypothetical protein